jgi:hypothetical protein
MGDVGDFERRYNSREPPKSLTPKYLPLICPYPPQNLPQVPQVHPKMAGGLNSANIKQIHWLKIRQSVQTRIVRYADRTRVRLINRLINRFCGLAYELLYSHVQTTEK